MKTNPQKVKELEEAAKRYILVEAKTQAQLAALVLTSKALQDKVLVCIAFSLTSIKRGADGEIDATEVYKTYLETEMGKIDEAKLFRASPSLKKFRQAVWVRRST